MRGRLVKVWWSLACALGAACCFGVASAMQGLAARAVSDGTAKVDPRLLVRMLGQWRFVASIGLDFVGFIAQLIALRRLPLFAVQAVIAASLAVTAVTAAWFAGHTLAAREWTAVFGVVIGIAMLGSSAGPSGATGVGNEFRLGLIVAVAVFGVAGVAAARLPGKYRTIALGLIAGLGYGVVGVAARILVGFSPADLLRDPATYALAAAGVISFLFYASALEHGDVTVATAATVLAETVLPAIIGVLFLGDTTRHGLVGFAAVGFALAVAGAVTLARFGEAEPAPALARTRDNSHRLPGAQSAR
jgi:drug/metabolite transporter (DMT)-like permease